LDTSIEISSISEAGVSKEAYCKRILNTIGGLSWKNPQQWVEWQIEVPTDGIYQIDRLGWDRRSHAPRVNDAGKSQG
jgi:hypothetical protein